MITRNVSLPKAKIEYGSMPDETQWKIGDVVQVKDTKEIVRIVGIDNWRYIIEPVSSRIKQLWGKMLEKGKR